MSNQPSSRPRAPRSPRRRRRIRLLRTALVILLFLAAGCAIIVRSALAGPSTDDPSIRLADWGRAHGLGFAVTELETIQYQLSPPTSGGSPDTATLRKAATEVRHEARSTRLPAVASQVQPALSGEGVFTPAPGDSTGRYLQVARLRPDSVHTSYLTSVVWMSHLDTFSLHPGYNDPGPTQPWTESTSVTPADYAGLLATFNGGFKLKDAGGGYFDHGYTFGNLVPGAASLVIDTSGHATVGTWGKDVKAGPSVAFVRQNLQPLVLNGHPVANLDSNVQSNWGATVGGDLAVWRSGIGVTSAGDLVYVAGEALTVQALASILSSAGAVTGMQLDINKSWVSVMSYTHSGGQVTPHKLADFYRPARRYLSSTSRDFVVVHRPQA